MRSNVRAHCVLMTPRLSHCQTHWFTAAAPCCARGSWELTSDPWWDSPLHHRPKTSPTTRSSYLHTAAITFIRVGSLVFIQSFIHLLDLFCTKLFLAGGLLEPIHLRQTWTGLQSIAEHAHFSWMSKQFAQCCSVETMQVSLPSLKLILF